MRTLVAVVVAILTVQALGSKSSVANENSSPIVDVRIDSPYRQVLPSVGDEWAPTWGRDDVLYTGNDDGSSFGGVPSNAITFGKLEGTNPYNLLGTTISGMTEYREKPVLGPEGAYWRHLDSHEFGGVRYAFVSCDSSGAGASASCMAKLGADGKTWERLGDVRAPGLFEGTRFAKPFFVAYLTRLESSFPADYAYAAAYAGVIDGEDQYVFGRVPKAKLAAQELADWSFMQSDWSWTPNLASAKPSPNTLSLGPDGANWKTMNTYSVDGVLYMFVVRCTYPSSSNDPKRRHTWQNSSIIKSTDGGRTWTRSAQKNLENPMFPGRRFGTPYFVWYGKDGAASVDNADRYVYAVSNNGFFENGDDYIIGRVLRSKLPDLNAADWSFYVGGNGMADAGWTAKFDKARPVLVNPDRSGMTGMTYIEPLRRYMMAVWRYNQDNFEAGIKTGDLSTVVEFFEAPKPWGPWTSVKSLQTGKLGWYAPIIGQRFQRAKGPGTAEAFLYVTGFYTRPEGGLDSTLYKFTYMPITLSTKPLQHKDPDYAGGR